MIYINLEDRLKKITVTNETFKKLCMKSNTESAELFRTYFSMS